MRLPRRVYNRLIERVAGPIIRLEMDAVARQSGDHPRQRTAAINRARDKIMNGTMASMLYDYQTMLETKLIEYRGRGGGGGRI